MSKINLTFDGGQGLFHSIQGEGRYTGVPSVFIRLSGCNLRCEWHNPDGSSSRCDTPYSSFNPESNVRSIDDIMGDVARFNCEHVVVTGGEPFLQPDVVTLIDQLVTARHFVTVETNATRYLPTRAQFISLSPKLPSSQAVNNLAAGVATIVPKTINAFLQQHDCQMKFVVNDPADFAVINEFVAQYAVPRQAIYCMPQGTTAAMLRERSDWLIELCKKYDYNFCPRLHIMLWGDKRGV